MKGLPGCLPEDRVSFISEHMCLLNHSYPEGFAKPFLPRMFCSPEIISVTSTKEKNRVGGVFAEALWLTFHHETLLCDVSVRGWRKPAFQGPR